MYDVPAAPTRSPPRIIKTLLVVFMILTSRSTTRAVMINDCPRQPSDESQQLAYLMGWNGRPISGESALGKEAMTAAHALRGEPVEASRLSNASV